ncbi:SPW repeat-containing protein [Rhodococcus sp. SMB37]|uniref:SPW repeat domain-containing protein n=1 Tax=Rhodococcus sp. SMB37 TaxID=2512213 RepID=UPI00104E72F8|nr:SPW repeat protein [Rhodococcus sp. SMB37]TCN46295.1 SPW repeat-containing protein [Rhodococcus sp. SMB37]
MTDTRKLAGGAAALLGLVTMSAGIWADTTPVGSGLTLGFGALATLYALWSLIARNPTKDHWALSVVGLVLFVVPWVGQYAGDAAAWTSWISGALIMLIAGTAYVQDESDDLTEKTERHDRETYRVEHTRV